MINLAEVLQENITEAINILASLEDKRMDFNDLEANEKPWVFVSDFNGNLIEAVVNECFIDEYGNVALNLSDMSGNDDYITCYTLNDCIAYTANNVCEYICDFSK